MESVVRGRVARCFSRPRQVWLTHVEDVAFSLRVVGVTGTLKAGELQDLTSVLKRPCSC